LGIETRSPPTLDVVRGRAKRAVVDRHLRQPSSQREAGLTAVGTSCSFAAERRRAVNPACFGRVPKGAGYDRVVFHRGWERVDGKLIDTRALGPFRQAKLLTQYECLVEFAGEDGQAVRLKVEEPLGVRLPHKGGVVPLLVKPDGSEAVVDKHDPRINREALMKAEKQAGKARFDSELK
jgi:hypothetical protein